MKLLQDKLDFLLCKYSVDAKAVLKDRKTVVIDSAAIPLLPHRSHRTFIELKNIVTGGTLEGISVMRVARITEKNADIYDTLYRELDICRFVLNRKLKTVTAMQNGKVLNAIATAEDGVVCTIEIAATLKEGEPCKEKHEIISQRGIACDIVVDAQLRQDSIYVFGEENKRYTDVDFELYGLSADDIAIVRSAFAIAQKGNGEEMIGLDRELKNIVEKAKLSAKNGETEVL